MSTLAQRSFSGGELTPSLYARTDIAKYVTSLRTCRNYYILKHGGARMRSGTGFVGEINDSSEQSRLIPFIFSNEETYVLEFGFNVVRFIKDGSYITETGQSITGITQANPGVVTITGHGYSNGDEVAISGVLGMTELNGRNFLVNNVTANTFELQDKDGVNFDTSGLTAYVSGGTASKIYEVTNSGVTSSNLFTFKYVQSADVFSYTTGGYAVRELKRFSDTNWTIEVVQSGKSVPATNNNAFYDDTQITGFSIAPSPVGPTGIGYAVTAVSRSTGRETLLQGITDLLTENVTPTGGSPNTLTWSPVEDASYYKVYYNRSSGESYRLLAEVIATTAGTVTYVDDGTDELDLGHLSPPPANAGTYTYDTNWDVIGDFPNDDFNADAITYYQQRLVLSSGETVRLSEIGNFKQFEPAGNRVTTASSPVTFTVAGRTVNNIKHVLDLNGLVMFTESAEIVAQGNSAGTVTPTDVNLRTQSYNGCGDLPPIVVNNTALYLQERGSIVRDFQYSESVNGYSGNDLSIFSTHLFDDYELVDWTYDKVPNSTIWAVRNDGTLLGLTYMQEHQVLAWHRHDFDGGEVESVCAIPEGNEDVLYLIVKRTVNGSVRRYVERMSTSQIVDIEDVKRMDSFLTYDGRHTGSTTQTLSGGTTWDYDETITLTASASTFSTADVGRQIHLTGSDGTIIRFTVEGFTSDTVVTGKPNKQVPVGMRSVAISTWSTAVKEVTGLWHIEGKTLSVFGDGLVVASPNNEAYTTLTVTNGSVTLPEHYAVIHAGLPYVADIETLDIDTSQGETGRDKKHIVSNVSLFTEETRGLWVGAKAPEGTDPLEDLYEIKLRNEETHDEPVELKTEVIDVKIKSEWNSNGRIFIRQVDPVPSTILSIMPEGNFTLR